MLPLHDNNPTRRVPFITIILIVINVAVFLYTNSLSLRAQSIVYRDYGLIPLKVTATFSGTTAVSFVTSMFLHGGLLHIAGNMLFLWIFGNNIEDRLGKIRFILFYAVCGILASLAQIAIDSKSPIPQIGASGAIAGVLGGYIVLFPHAKIKTLIFVWYFIRLADISAVWVLGLWFALQLFNGVTSFGQANVDVAFFAHIGGFIAGVLLIKVFGAGAVAWYNAPAGDPAIPPIDQPRSAGKWWD